MLHDDGSSPEREREKHGGIGANSCCILWMGNR